MMIPNTLRDFIPRYFTLWHWMKQFNYFAEHLKIRAISYWCLNTAMCTFLQTLKHRSDTHEIHYFVLHAGEFQYRKQREHNIILEQIFISRNHQHKIFLLTGFSPLFIHHVCAQYICIYFICTGQSVHIFKWTIHKQYLRQHNLYW